MYKWPFGGFIIDTPGIKEFGLVHIDKSELQNQLNYINSKYNFNLNLDLWCDFINEMKPIESGQMELFA